VLAPATAVADLVPDTQPAFQARTVAFVTPLRVYADPALPATERGLRNASLPDAVRRAMASLDRDPRYTLVRDVDARLVAAARTGERSDVQFIAERSTALGIDHFRSFNLATGASELRSALDGFARTLSAWVRPSTVAEAWQYLALTELALARAEPDRAVEREARAVSAFRSMIRVAPQRSIDPDAFPRSVVDAYERAYAAHFLDAGQLLRLSASEGRQLAEALGVMQVIHVVVLHSTEQTALVVQVWDDLAQQVVFDEHVVVEPTTRGLADALTASLSRAAACQPLLPPPDAVVIDRERGSVYLGVGYSGGSFLGTETRRPFWMHGATIHVSGLLRESIGLYGSTSIWRARRDRDGDLIGALDVVRGSAGAESSARFGRLRLFGRAGLDVTRIGRLRATTSFWCKVSEGEPFVFDGERSCEADDLVDNRARIQLGPRFTAGLSARLAGPVWFQASADLTLFVAPFDDRDLDTPFGVDLGLVYRF
jgi:hypothetical protein